MFSNIYGPLKTPIKILSQGVQEGVEVENDPTPKNLSPHFSKTFWLFCSKFGGLLGVNSLYNIP